MARDDHFYINDIGETKMLSRNISVGTLYTHKKSNSEIYKVLYLAKMQIGNSWIDCVVYSQYNENTEEIDIGRVFVREYNNFFDRFSEYSDWFSQVL